jgi:hypothetical protein
MMDLADLVALERVPDRRWHRDPLTGRRHCPGRPNNSPVWVLPRDFLHHGVATADRLANRPCATPHYATVKPSYVLSAFREHRLCHQIPDTPHDPHPPGCKTPAASSRGNSGGIDMTTITTHYHSTPLTIPLIVFCSLLPIPDRPSRLSWRCRLPLYPDHRQKSTDKQTETSDERAKVQQRQRYPWMTNSKRHHDPAQDTHRKADVHFGGAGDRCSHGRAFLPTVWAMYVRRNAIGAAVACGSQRTSPLLQSQSAERGCSARALSA